LSSAKKLRKPWTFERPLCKEIGGEVFFIDDFDDPRGMDTNSSNVQIAKKLCSKCEHQIECAEWGIHHERYGVWGGLSQVDLAAIRKRKNILLEIVDIQIYI